ncbi:MAG: SufD family Fe-S cluster assembly protein, partial [Steroidobacteraceae bacterium]
MTSSALSKRALDEYATVRESLPTNVVSRERRQQAIEALAARGLPTTRDENWRYSNLRPLERARFAPVIATLPPPSEADLPPRLEGFARCTFIDGVFAPELSSPREQAGLAVRNLPPHVPALSSLPEARLALLNEAFATDTAIIHVSGGADQPASVELVFVALAGADVGTSYPRVQVRLDPACRLTLVERHVSAGGAANFVNSSVNVDVGRGAHLTHYRLQQASTRATWIDTLSAVLAADARYGVLAVYTGAQSARSTTYVQMAGAGAELVLSLAALGDRQQIQDNFALVEHIAPRARTEQTFRGIASGRA